MTHKKKNLWASTGTHDPFFDNPKIWPTFIYRGEMCKKPLFLSLFLEKRVQIGKKSKKNCCGHQLWTMTYFPNITHLTHFYIWGVKCSGHIFLKLFLRKNRSNNKIFGKKNLWASTRSHDPFFDNPKIWPTFIYRGKVPAHTFAKLPVHALITDLKKFDPKKVISVKTPHLAMWPTSLSRPKYFGTSPKLPVHALIHDP